MTTETGSGYATTPMPDTPNLAPTLAGGTTGEFECEMPTITAGGCPRGNTMILSKSGSDKLN
jgi:hypothetical protein